jgi:hypothetical protein
MMLWVEPVSRDFLAGQMPRSKNFARRPESSKSQKTK